MDWSVYVEAAGPPDAPPLDEWALELFAEHLSVYSPAVSGAVAPEQERIWSAQLAVSEDHGDPAAAAQHAIDLVISAARTAGLPSWPVVKLEVTDWERFDAELDEPNTPDLVGVAELAELCGVTRQRASVLARSGEFPEPLAELASGPVWDLRMVQRFVREWARKPGRPAKSAKPSAGVANPAAVIAPAARASRHLTVEAKPARRRTSQKETRMGLVLDILNDIRAQIAVDDDVLEEARNRRDLVAAAAMEIDGVLRWFRSGSVAHGTVNAPVTDADAGIVLDRRSYPSLGPDGDGEGPEDIVKELGELVGPVVRESYPDATVRHSRRGLYVAFAAPLDGEQDPTVDLIVTLTRKGTAGLWIPDLDNNEWSASHPEKHTQLFTSGSKKQRALRARTARLAKAWNKQWAKDNRALSSFNIETLVWEYIDDDASVPLDEALAGWFAYAHDELEKGRTKEPAGVSEDIKLLLPKQTVLRRLAGAADRLEQALEDEDDEAKVKDLLAGVYPHYVEPPAQSKSAMAAALRKGNQGVGASKTGLVVGGGTALKTTRSYGKDEQG